MMEGREFERTATSVPQTGGDDGAGGEVKDSPSSTPSSTPSPPAASAAAPTFIVGLAASVPPSTGSAAATGTELGMAPMGMMTGSGSSGENLAKKKRGRPRKYGPDCMALALCPTSPDSSGTKRGRGRPPGCGPRQILATLGDWFAFTAGGNFTPHVVTVATGEDVTARILSFSQKGPRSICILSANGAISNVTLRQPGSSGGTLTYEGRFEILSLSGSFTIAENGSARSSRAGGISVSLAGPDGRVVGGGVAGSLLAASPIQVIVGSFIPNTLKEHKRKSNQGPSTCPPIQTSASPLMSARPISQANPDDDCETPNSAILAAQNHGDPANRGSNHPDPNSASFRAPVWKGMQQSQPDNKPSPDINRASGFQGQQPLSEHRPQPLSEHRPSPDINRAPGLQGLQPLSEHRPQPLSEHRPSPDINRSPGLQGPQPLSEHRPQPLSDHRPSPDINRAPGWQGLQPLSEHRPSPDINRAPGWQGLQPLSEHRPQPISEHKPSPGINRLQPLSDHRPSPDINRPPSWQGLQSSQERKLSPDINRAPGWQGPQPVSEHKPYADTNRAPGWQGPQPVSEHKPYADTNRPPGWQGLQSPPEHAPSPDINRAPGWQGLQSLPKRKTSPDINKAPSWQLMQCPSERKQSPDINICLPRE